MLPVLLLLLPPLLASQRSDNAEVLLRRGSSFLSLSESLALGPGALLGFSFRTCLAGGQLVTQYGDGADSLQVSLGAGGQLVVELRGGNQSRAVSVGSGLSDGGWHTVRLGVAPDTRRLCVGVDTDQECHSPSSSGQVRNGDQDSALDNVRRLDNMASLLTSLNFTSPLRVGSGFVGCIREGPSLRFTKGGIENQVGVSWGSCLLPDSCQGKRLFTSLHYAAEAVWLKFNASTSQNTTCQSL